MKREIVISDWIKAHPIRHIEVAEYIDDQCVRIEWAYSEDEAAKIAESMK